MKLINCGPHQAEAIRAIFNEVIEHSTWHYDSAPRSLSDVQEWLEGKARENLPVIGLEDEGGDLAGFATYGPFRPQQAYRYTAEHSLYIEKRFRGKGLGGRLLDVLIAHAQTEGYHLLVGVIDSSNTPSIDLHKGRGFTHAGRLREAGFKFGTWLDVDLYQLVLPTGR
jgi:L-amino acid N-acyltransferase